MLELLSRRFRLLALIVGFCTLAAIVVSLLITPLFDANATLYFVQSSLPGMPQVGELAQGLGFSLSEEELGLEIPDIVSSRNIKDRLLRMSWEVPGEATTQTLPRLWGIDGLPDRESRDLGYATLEQRVTAEVASSGLITVTARMEDPELAASVANRVTGEVLAYLREQHTRNARQNRDHIEVRLAEVEVNLTASEDALRLFREKNRRIVDSPELQTQEARLLRDVQLNHQVYVTLKEQLELVRIEEIKNTPPISVLDVAVPPSRKAFPQRSKLVIAVFVISFVVAWFVVLLLEGIGLALAEPKQREAWTRIRRRFSWKA